MHDKSYTHDPKKFAGTELTHAALSLLSAPTIRQPKTPNNSAAQMMAYMIVPV